jgi:hypothetical protein
LSKKKEKEVHEREATNEIVALAQDIEGEQGLRASLEVSLVGDTSQMYL